MEKNTIYWIIGIILFIIIFKPFPINFSLGLSGFVGTAIPYFRMKGFFPWWIIIGGVIIYFVTKKK